MFGRGPENAAGGVKPHGQSRKLRRDERRGLRRKSAERALVVAMAGGTKRRVLARALRAEFNRGAEGRFEVGDSRRRFGPSNKWARKGLMIGDRDELNEKRQGGDERDRP